jgi:hypothetical protein
MGQKLGWTSQRPDLGRLVGKSNECTIYIENKEVKTLLDSGSQVSTISESLVKTLNLECIPLNHLLTIEVPGDQLLSYLGYVEANIRFDSGLNLDALLLVVSDTRYSELVPVLLGTNVLDSVYQLSREQRVEPKSGALKLAFQTLSSHHKSVQSTGYVTTTKAITVPATGQSVISGLTRAAAGCCMRMTVMAEDTARASLPGGLTLLPGVVHLQPGCSTQRVSLQVSNFSDKDIVIPQKTRICELQVADVVPPKVDDDVDESAQPFDFHFNDTTEIGYDFTEQLRENLEDKQVTEVQQLLSKWSCVFSKHDLDLGHTNLVKHTIKLTDDTPFKERHRRIPPHMVDEVRSHIKEMLNLGVIRRSESPYASGVVLVRKKDGSLRFCIDL